MRLLAIIVSYYPDLDLLRRNLESITDYVDKILIWENTPEKDKFKYRLEPTDKLIYLGDGINSISRGLNNGWKYAKENGYDYLLLLDQDSIFQNLDYYLSKTIDTPKAPVGIWGPEVNEKKANEEFEEVETCITSGMLLSVQIIDKIGGWDELFPIDSVDLDFCICASELGIKTYMVKGAFLKQRFGNTKILRIFGKDKIQRNYPSKRLYTYYRDILILNKKHPENQFVKKSLIVRLKLIKGILFYESDRINKAIAIFKGIIAGLTYSHKAN